MVDTGLHTDLTVSRIKIYINTFRVGCSKLLISPAILFWTKMAEASEVDHEVGAVV